MKKTVVPISVKITKEVKAMELELAKVVLIDRKDPKIQKGLVEKIADAKEKMTMAH